MTEDDQADLTAKRERFIAAYIERTGKTREQTLAVMDLVASGFRRRGWAPGDPLTDEARRECFNTMLGGSETGGDQAWATTDGDGGDT